MQTPSSSRAGGCACGAVRFETRGSPKRGGLCHCLTCRKAHASAFNPFVVFDPEALSVTGPVLGWQSSPGYVRFFCAACGSRVYAHNQAGDAPAEVELSLASYDAVGWFSPQYESWTVRREPWLTPLDTPQHARERQDGGGEALDGPANLPE